MTVALHSIFAEAARPKRSRTPKGKAPRPISIRVTPEERAQIEQEAGERILSDYARSRLFGGKAARRGPDRRPSADSILLAQILAKLGQSGMAGNLHRIADAVYSGTVESGETLFATLAQACADIATIRCDLIRALDIKQE